MSQLPPGGIVTPEAVVLEFHTAGLGTRTLAKLIDLLVMGLTLLVLLFVSSEAGLLTGASLSQALMIVSVLVFVVFVLAPALVETLWNGRSPGKAALGIKVVTLDGGPISFRHALVRGLVQLVELPTGVAMLVALANRRSQRLGDLLAGTFVVRVRASTAGAGAVAFYPPPGCEGFVNALDVTRLTSQQFVLIRKFLLRATELDGAARFDLAARAATPVSEVVTPAPPMGMPAELYLVCVASAYQIRNGGLPPIAPPVPVPAMAPLGPTAPPYPMGPPLASR